MFITPLSIEIEHAPALDKGLAPSDIKFKRDDIITLSCQKI